MVMNETKKDIKDLSVPQIEEEFKGLGLPAFRAKQVIQWIFQKGASDWSEMTNLSKELREVLRKNFYITNLEVLTKQVSKLDGTKKYLFELADGNAIETVVMSHDYGTSVCVSTQVGCKMGCGFCASTIGGLVRNLTMAEIFDQVMKVQKDTEARVSSVVIMGSGEPLENYRETLRFIKLVNAEYSLNIGYRHITISTCGLVPKIYDLADENMQITLSISLHAPNNELRNQIMPVNRRYSIEDLLEACRYYIEITNRRITFEYSLIAGVNDSPNEAKELASKLKGMLCHVNLIPINPVVERGYAKPNKTSVSVFAEILRAAGIETTIRREKGGDIDAACGQLRRKVLEKGGEM